MPLILKPEETPLQREGEGWKVLTLADRKTLGQPAMAAYHWSLRPNATGPQIHHGDYDEMLYVISGSGTAVVGDQRLPLEPESVLWLEAGDRCHFEAGAAGLEILQGYAPEA